jgi:hypothetical protein
VTGAASAARPTPTRRKPVSETPTPPPDDPPSRVSEEDVEVMEHPDEHFDPDAPPEEIDRQQTEDARVSERDADWVDPRERVGGD